MKTTEQNRSAAVVAVIPNAHLRQTILEILLDLDKPAAVTNEAELFDTLNKDPGAVPLLDIFDMREDYRQLLQRLARAYPDRPVVLLVSGELLPLCALGDAHPRLSVVEIEEAGTRLLPAISAALEDIKHASARVISFPTQSEREVNGMGQKNERIWERKFTRRSFIKGAAATAAAASVAVSGGVNLLVPKAEAAEEAGPGGDQIFYGPCRGNCEGACRIKIAVRDGKIVKCTMGEFSESKYNRICTKGLSHVQQVYHADRLKYPMRRVGKRGEGQWEQITWDEAFDEIATKWKSYAEQHGGSSINFAGGTGNAGYGTRISGKLVSLIGASQAHYCYDMAFNYGSENALGIGNGWNVNEPSEFDKSGCIIVWGSNPSEATLHFWHFIMEAKEAGAKLIVIDPTFTIAASKADLHVPIRPCTDAALYMCLTNLAIERGHHDTEFLKKSTVGPFLVKESDGMFLRLSDLGEAEAGSVEDAIVVIDNRKIAGRPAEIDDPVLEGSHTVNGIRVTTAFTLLKNRVSEWTLAKTSELCDISESMIEEILRNIVEHGPVVGYQGFGPDHYNNGHKPYFAMQALLAVTGNLAKPGASGGVGFPYDNAFRMITYAINALPPEYKSGPVIPAPMLAETINTGKIGETPINIKSLHFMVHNPLCNVSQRGALMEAIEKVEFIVAQDFIMTETTRYADLILPASHWFEQWDMFIAASMYAMLQEKAIEPLYETKTDYDILSGIGKRMGFEEYFTLSQEEFLSACFDSGIGGLTWEGFKEEKCIRAPVARNGENGKILTRTGRFQFYQETVAPNVSYGQQLDASDIEKERLPHFEPPFEAWPVSVGGYERNPLAAKYPLIYTSERSKFKTHTMWGHNPWLLELIPEPIIKLNPGDAADRGVKQGDYVKVYNDRGYVVIKAVLNPGIRPGMVVIPKGWEEGQFKEGHYQNLTSNATHKVCVNNNYFDALCEVVKA